MKAIVHDEYGTAEGLELREIEQPKFGDKDVLVKVRSAGVDRGVWHVMTGLPYPIRLAGFGLRAPKNPVIGADFAGVVEAVGMDVATVQPGDEIFGVAKGSYAEYAVALEGKLARKPRKLSFDEAAVVPTSATTALQALRKGKVETGHKVLITGASGGVSTAAIQIAKHAGAHVYAVTTAENMERVRGLGADVVYDRRETDYSKEIWRDTDRRGVDLIFDSVGEATWSRNIRAAARAGRIVVYGGTTGPRLETDARQLFWKQLEIIGTTMSSRAEFRAVMDLVFADTSARFLDPARIGAFEQGDGLIQVEPAWALLRQRITPVERIQR